MSTARSTAACGSVTRRAASPPQPATRAPATANAAKAVHRATGLPFRTARILTPEKPGGGLRAWPLRRAPCRGDPDARRAWARAGRTASPRDFRPRARGRALERGDRAADSDERSDGQGSRHASKLGLRDRFRAAVFAYENGVVWAWRGRRVEQCAPGKGRARTRGVNIGSDGTRTRDVRRDRFAKRFQPV